MAEAAMFSSAAALEMLPCRKAVVKYSIALREIAMVPLEIRFS
jgi:hypothetical protein